MSTVTINITMPKKLKSEVDKQVKAGFYTSVSEFIRAAIRSVLSTDADIPYGPGFSPQAEKQILKAEKEALAEKNPVIITSQKQLRQFLDSL
jgi:putative addiction module CopG family antidote